MSDACLVVEDLRLDGGTLRALEFNRPDKRNCLSLTLMDAMISALRAAEQSAVLIGGRGAAFCTGLDLEELYTSRGAGAHLRRLIELLEAIATHPSPVVCGVRGAAYGGGVAIACCADAVLATEGARFKLPGNDVLQPLVAVVLPMIAARRGLPVDAVRAITGMNCTAAEARERRLIDAVVAELDDPAATWRAAEPILRRRERWCDPASAGRSDATSPRYKFESSVTRETAGLLEQAARPDAVQPLLDVLAVRYGSTNERPG